MASRNRRRRTRAPGAAARHPARGGASRPVPELCALSPFSVFCTLWLGITDTDGFRPRSRAEVARAFALDAESLDAYLREHALDAAALERAGFDLESARFDIQVAPVGISRTELARTLFAELTKPDPADPRGR
ncbi:MAG: hypothetical protein ACE5IL_04375 [Myxococcota bacterium]